MVHPANNLWGHVSRCPTGFLCVVLFSLSSDSEVSNSSITIFLKHNILGFQVPVNNVAGVNILQGQDNAADHKLCSKNINTSLVFIKILIEAHMISEISTSQILHNQVQIVPVLEVVARVYYERILKLIQKLFLVHYAIHAFFGYHPE